MYADFVSGHVLFNEQLRSLRNTRSDDEEGSRKVLLLEEIEDISGKRVTLEKMFRHSLLRVFKSYWAI